MKKQNIKKTTIKTQIIEGGFWAGSANFLNKIGALIFTIILARFLFPENFGLYSLTISIAFIFMAFADLGINETLIRFFSLREDSKRKKIAYFQYIFKIKTLLTLLVSLLLLASAYPLAFYIFKKPALFYPLILASLFILSSLFFYFFSSFFYALKKTKYIGISEILFQTIRIIIVLLVFYFLSSAYHVLGAIAGIILANAILLFLLIYWTKKFAPGVFKKIGEKIDKRHVLKFIGYSVIVAISGMFFTYIDAIMLGLFVPFSYIGFYKVAFSLIFGIIGLFTYVCLVLLPFFTSLTKQRLKDVFNKSVRFVLIFSIPAAFGVLALGKYIIGFLYGQPYLQAQFPFYILSFLLISWAPTILMVTLLFSKGKLKQIAKINIVLNFILIYYLLKISELAAIIGAAIATLISRYYLFFFITKTTRKELKIKIQKIIFIKPIIAGLIMFVFLLVLDYLIKDMTILLGAISIILGATVYFIIMFLIKGITIQDIEILKLLIKKRGIKK